MRPAVRRTSGQVLKHAHGATQGRRRMCRAGERQEERKSKGAAVQGLGRAYSAMDIEPVVQVLGRRSVAPGQVEERGSSSRREEEEVRSVPPEQGRRKGMGEGLRKRLRRRCT